MDSMILSTSQIRICEKHTMDDSPISSIDLMEEAGTTCANEISDILFQRNIDNVFVFCGTGNNNQINSQAFFDKSTLFYDAKSSKDLFRQIF